MADLFELSRRVLDAGDADGVGPLNRINHELSVLGDTVAMVEAFSHAICFETDAGLVVFDTSNERGGSRVVDAIRGWRDTPFHSLVFTHGHIDHVGGSGAFVADARARGHARPQIVAHENVPNRFARYNTTNGYNQIINRRQFGQFASRGYDLGVTERFLPADVAYPELTYRDRLNLSVGGLAIELRHARGETDDHTWAWIPEHKAICAGDFFIWNFPNAGNPQKVQRYPLEWAAAMRDMAGMGAEMFLPAHGLPIQGAERIERVLGNVADVLETVVRQTLELMNAGARRIDIVHAVKVDPAELEKPYLKPFYDEPEFVVNNIWRQFGGWWDGNPAHLKPAPEAALGRELANLAGGAVRLAERARELSGAGEHRLACHLVEHAFAAAPDDAAVHEHRAAVYQARRDQETSLMAKGIFGGAANESAAHGADA